MAELLSIPVAQLQLAAYNPRKTFDEASIAELAQSMKNRQLQPILVRLLTPAKGKKAAIYEVVCGARRIKAAIVAGLPEVICTVAELTDDEAEEAALTENLEREDVKPMEEARAFAALMDRGYTLQQLGERFHKSHVHIWNRVQLAKATPGLQEAIESGKIPLTYARELAKFPEHVQVEEVKDKGWAFKRDPKMYVDSLLSYYGVDLNLAPFDTAKVGCVGCQFEATTLGLAKSKFLCLHKAKYVEHAKAHVLSMIADDPTLKLVVDYFDIEKATEMWKDQLPANRVIIKLGYYEAYDRVDKPRLPKLQEFEPDEFDTPDEYQEALADAQHDYDLEMEEYNEAIEKYNERLSAGMRGLMMFGKHLGKVVLLEARNSSSSQKAKEFAQLDGDECAAEKLALKEQIGNAKERAERMPKLGEQKAYEAAINQINELAIYKGIDTTDAQPALIPEEWDALYLMLLDKFDYRLPKNLITALFGKSERFSALDDKAIKKALALKDQLFPLLFRKLLQREFQPSDGKQSSHLNRFVWDKIALSLEDVDYHQVSDVRANYGEKLAKAKAKIAELEAAYALLDKEVAQ